MRYRGGGIGHSVNAQEARPVSTDAASAMTDENLEEGDNQADGMEQSHYSDADPGEGDGGEAPPEDDIEKLAEEAEEYGYDPQDDDDESDTPGSDLDENELGPEDGEDEVIDDVYGAEGYAPF